MDDDEIDDLDQLDEVDQRGIRTFIDSLGTEQPRPKAGTMLRDLYGRGRDALKPDTARAAAALGVSRRTVQRWVQQGRLPAPGRSPHADQVRTQWADSPAGRARRIPADTRRKLTAGAPVLGRVTGKVWVSSDSRNGSDRTFSVHFDADEAASFYQAMINANDEGAYAAFHAATVRGFGGSVDVHVNQFRLN